MLRVLTASWVPFLAAAGLALLLVGLVIMAVLRRRSVKLGQMIAAAVAINAVLASVALIGVGGYGVWYANRPRPAVAAPQALFEGIIYSRDVLQQPRPLIVHVVKVDLRVSGVRFMVTPGEPGVSQPLRARTTSGFLSEFKLQLAVNGGFFFPYHSNSPIDYYPRIGDPVNSTGVSASRGMRYSLGNGTHPALYLSEDNQPSFDPPADGKLYNVISGNSIFMRDGKVLVEEIVDPLDKEPQPRTAVAFTQDRQTLLIFVVDGRQNNYSEGVTVAELGEIALRYGAYAAINLDGGGSTTLAVQSGGGVQVLNSPIDNYIPGRERAVGNHLGLFANPVKP